MTAIILTTVISLVAAAGCSTEDGEATPDKGTVSADTGTPAVDTTTPTPDTGVAPDTASACSAMCDEACSGQIECSPEAAPSQLPGQYPVGQFVIGGFEYWPWAESQPLYPDKIKWGYNSGTANARACMAAAYRRLIRILENPPKELVEFSKKHGVVSFYNWNNDYTGASGDDIAPAQYQLPWLYQENLIKWISGTHRDGTCVILEAKHLVDFANKCMKSYPNC